MGALCELDTDMLVHDVRGYHKGSLFFEETSQVKLTVQNHGVMLPKFLVKFPSTCQNFVLLCKETKALGC